MRESAGRNESELSSAECGEDVGNASSEKFIVGSSASCTSGRR